MLHLRPLLLAASTALVMAASAQDTLRVQTLSFDSITARRGWYVFPDTTHHYRKVLMHHTLKCDAATTQDQYPCGEWDYLTYNFIHEHTGQLDSNAYEHPWFEVGRLGLPSVELSPAPTADTWLEPVPRRTITGVATESEHVIGVSDAADGNTLLADRGTVRSQFILTAQDLAAAGLVAGLPIDRLRLEVSLPGAVERITLRLKNTAATTLSTFDEAGLVTVHQGDGAVFQNMGIATLELHAPFAWDGVSNLLVDIAAANWTGGQTPVLVGTNTVMGEGVQQVGRDGHVRVDNDFIGLAPAPLATLSTEVTVMFWAKGGVSLPLNTSAFEARNAQNNRVLNIHLPWSNGNVYWDAGNTGGSYDRIFKAALPAEYQGQWNHWAFTKNTTTGTMKIYLNGVLWHSGNGFTRPMGGIVRANFGADADRNNPYPGELDDLAIFDQELDAATIAQLAGRAIDPAHPSWSAIVCAYGFNETTDLPHKAENLAVSSAPGWLMGTVQRVYERPEDLRGAELTVSVRPDITFVQGTYSDVLDTLVRSWPEPLPGTAVEHFQVSGNAVVPVDTVFGYGTGWQYTYAADSSAQDSTLATGAVLVNDTLHYFGVPFELVRDWEIGRYITPYGIGLNLGANGFTWTFDVTDYQFLLHDSVELSAGNQQELIDLDFELIEGEAPRPVVNVQRPWGPLASRSYGALSDDSQMAAITVQLHPQATQWALRSRLTGHGHNSNDGTYPHCCEWKDNTHYLYANGFPVDEWHVWQTNDCALNPVYPQGGTWLGSREGWCPGDVVKDHVTELTPYVTSSALVLDYAITPVPSTNIGMAGGNYVMNMDLFEFGPATHAVDAEIHHVKRPSDEGYQRRDNPICNEPVVVLRNAGAQDLTSVEFAYGVSGGNLKYHTWTGLLKHMQQEEVTLPVTDGAFWAGDSDQLFTVSVVSANGGADGYAANDSYTTHFALPAMYSDNFIVYMKTNNRPAENSITIRDIVGTVVYSRTNMAANTVYQDTLELWDGCYSIEVLDTGNDGLSYWADPDAGVGQFRLKKKNGATLKSFQSEFGRSLHWSFTLNGFVGINEPERAFALSAFPNPTSGEVRLHVEDMDGPAQLEVMDVQGRRVHARSLELTGTTETLIDLSGEAPGLYLVRLTCEGRSASLRVMRR